MNDEKPFISSGGKVGLSGVAVLFIVFVILMAKAGRGVDL